jgi:FRG domain
VLNSTLHTWKELAAVIPRLADRKWLFRGESKQGRPLMPKAGREGVHLKVEFNPIRELAALRLFKRQARPYLTHQPQSDIEWLAIAQHHGMHTRLLDWTESLLVAAYFAVDLAGTNGDPVIYGVSEIPQSTPDEESRPFEATRVSLYRPPHISVRIPAQQSVFTLHPNPTEIFEPPALRSWTIPSQSCMAIKRALDACGINQSSLFPGLDGLANYIGWRYKWGKLEE